MSNSVNVIFWDIGNVLLYPVHPPLLDRIFRHSRGELSREEYDSRAGEILNDSFLGRISLDETWQRLGILAGISSSTLTILRNELPVHRNEELLTSAIRDFSPVFRMGIMSDLSRIGYEIVRSRYTDLLKACDPKLVHLSITTGQTKVRGGEAYIRMLLQSSGIPPESALLIDDSIENIRAAKLAGMHAVQFTGVSSEGGWVEANRRLFSALSAFPSMPHPSIVERPPASQLPGDTSRDPSLEALVSRAFVSAANRETSAQALQDAISVGLDFKVARTGLHSVLGTKPRDQIIRELLEPIPEDGQEFSDVLDEFRNKIVDGSLNFSSPGFLSFPDCGNSVAALAGHILVGMLNQNLISSYTSPTASFAEISVINWLRELAGFAVVQRPTSIRDVGGVSVTGGVSANAVGMLLARENRFPGTIQSGLQTNPAQIRVFVPRSIGHYSVKASLGWIGLGQQSTVDVMVDENFRMDQQDLRRKIREAETAGEVPLALVAYAGDSRTMSIDDFPNLAQIAHDHGMWFHIDACHGFSLCFSDSMKERVKGIELADSITIDPHKVLFTPYSLSFVLLREPQKFSLISGVSDLITKETFSFGQMTPFFGSRPFNSLKLWFLVKALGRKNIGELIEWRHRMVAYFADLIRAQPEFHMMNTVTINSAVYVFAPEWLRRRLAKTTGRDEAVALVNQLNQNIQQRIVSEGRFHVHGFPLHDVRNVLGAGRDTVYFMQRLMLGNPLTTRDDLHELVAYSAVVASDEANRLRV